ncbi:MAG TPA: tetratricopeptide repeat protein [Chloroflexia bacterium]|nr:tetratricopeptide repeat protein [Chloroflexia bacterium]
MEALNWRQNAPDDDEYEEDDVLTNRLGSGSLRVLPGGAPAREPGSRRDGAHLRKLTTNPLDTSDLGRSAPPVPSGMAAHARPPRMAPTIGARLSTGLRRITLLALLAALVVGIVAGGVYLALTGPWANGLPTPPPASTIGDATTTQPVGQEQIGAPPAIAPPVDDTAPGTGGMPDDIAAAMAGVDARALRDRGIAAYQEGSYEEAVTLLSESVSLAGDDPIAQYQLGLSYMAVPTLDHALDDAELAFRSALSLQPEWAAPHAMLAESLLRRGFYAEAIAPAEEATRLDPTQSTAWLTLARAYEGANRPADATRAYAEATRRAPAPPQAP